jgi:integrase
LSTFYRKIKKESKKVSTSHGYEGCIILVAPNTGMRKAEILNLEWSQVNLKEGFITLVAQKTKSRKTRRQVALNRTKNGKQNLIIVSGIFGHYKVPELSST